ncbi:hypothetical protein [Streptomyces olivaceus]|uniref:hypothetical protein n=1 Tax=Streptomyces olivaceus TaxID=47716 RepID=UPI001CCEF289|nr:hypothetical protein [Streptomyces olivaceus]
MELVDLAEVLAEVFVGEDLAQGLDEVQAVSDRGGRADDVGQVGAVEQVLQVPAVVVAEGQDLLEDGVEVAGAALQGGADEVDGEVARWSSVGQCVTGGGDDDVEGLALYGQCPGGRLVVVGVDALGLE